MNKNWKTEYRKKIKWNSENITFSEVLNVLTTVLYAGRVEPAHSRRLIN